MAASSQRNEMKVRTIRDRQAEPERNEWMDLSPSERIEAVWMLTKLCLAWNNQLEDEPRLQRTVTRTQCKRR
jgi:hypothetical protein